MKYFSEKTKKFYPTEDECVAAEAAFEEKMAKIEAERKALAEARKERAKEVEDAYKKSEDARREYIEKRNQFIKDYGSFHMTVRSQELPNPIDDFFKYFF